jgi:hypothetical protein
VNPSSSDDANKKRWETEASLDKAFAERTVSSKTDEELLRFLYVLETRPVPNDLIRHREIGLIPGLCGIISSMLRALRRGEAQ